MAVRKDEIPPHRVLREVYRHYLEFRQLVAQDGRNHVLEHGYFIENPDTGERRKATLSLSFWDLRNDVNKLSDRKKEAFFYNVICDMKQRDVAERMGITTVSVGQYVEAACEQLAQRYFTEEELASYKESKQK
jgi:DNA-directed RNA polymerase specialized sigma24 family protein